jgi:hypothetical protein
MPTELTDFNITEVSGVDSAANLHEFIVRKNGDPAFKKFFDGFMNILTGKVEKSDEGGNMAFTVADLFSLVNKNKVKVVVTKDDGEDVAMSAEEKAKKMKKAEEDKKAEDAEKAKKAEDPDKDGDNDENPAEDPDENEDESEEVKNKKKAEKTKKAEDDKKKKKEDTEKADNDKEKDEMKKSNDANIKKMADIEKTNTELRSEIKKERDLRLDNEYIAKATDIGANLPIEKAKLGAILRKAAEVMPEHYEEIERLFKSANTTAAMSEIGTQTDIGKSDNGFLNEAMELVKNGKFADPTEAMMHVAKSNPAAYNAYITKSRSK